MAFNKFLVELRVYNRVGTHTATTMAFIKDDTDSLFNEEDAKTAVQEYLINHPEDVANAFRDRRLYPFDHPDAMAEAFSYLVAVCNGLYEADAEEMLTRFEQNNCIIFDINED